jgi:uncharacterized membrane protein
MNANALGAAPLDALGGERLAGSTATAVARPRLDSVDLVRGFVMVVMAIDHARDMLGAGHFDPTDLTRTSPALFFTRWITHLCAPAFVLLAGTGAFLSRKPRGALSRFLLTRGLWLVVVEITIVKLAWTFNLDPLFTPLQVIWAIGCSMIALAGLVWLPAPIVALFGAAMIATHNLFDPIVAGPLFIGAAPDRVFVGTLRDCVVSLLHVQNPPFIYPLIPWIGVIAIGYALGPVFLREPARRRRMLIVLGTTLCAAFLVVRGLNGYGDPHPWAQQRTALFTAMSFLNTTKYPASLDYLMMTLGPVLLLLAVAERLRGALAAALVVFGRVPLFFYVLHLYLIHAVALVLGIWTGFGAAPFLKPWPAFPKAFGISLTGVYLAWILVVLSLYPACRWFARVKARRRDWWLSYL